MDQSDSDSATNDNGSGQKKSESIDEQVALAKSEENYSDTEHEIIYLDGSECGNDEHDQNEMKFNAETEIVESCLPNVQQSAETGECLLGVWELKFWKMHLQIWLRKIGLQFIIFP